jgi:hypothetical protein
MYSLNRGLDERIIVSVFSKRDAMKKYMTVEYSSKYYSWLWAEMSGQLQASVALRLEEEIPVPTA